MAERKTKTSPEVKQRYNKKVYSGIYVQLPKDLVAEFKTACAEKGISQAQVVKKAIEEFLNK